MSLTPEQHLIRRTGLTASEIAALAGLSKFATPMTIYERKTLPPKAEEDVSIPIFLGNELEEPIAKLWSRKTGMNTAACATMRHPTKRFAICTPDRGGFIGAAPVGEVLDQGDKPLLSLEQLAKADVLVQCKSTSWRMKGEWGEEGTDAIPEEYICQEVWEMGITGHRSADVAVLVDKDAFKVYHVGFSETLFNGLYDLAERFMTDNVLALSPPTVDASERCKESLQRLFPTNRNDKMIPTPDFLGETIARFAVLRNAKKTITTACDLYANRLRLAIGDAAGMQGPYGKISWKQSRDGKKIDHAGMASELRGLLRGILDRHGAVMPATERESVTMALSTLDARFTSVKPGNRPLRPTWTKGFAADLAGETTLDLSAVAAEIAALPPGEEEFDPVTGEVSEE
jgi:putative phage-type endonuclease